MLKESLLADLRCPNENDIQAPFSIENPATITLRQFLQHAGDKMSESRFFLVVDFPEDSVIVKYKFEQRIFVPKEYGAYLDHPVLEIAHILDDGGSGTFVTVA